VGHLDVRCKLQIQACKIQASDTSDVPLIACRCVWVWGVTERERERERRRREREREEE
jgi:hypothetical protein